MARKNNISGKVAREMLKGMTARDIKKMSHGELVSLAKAPRTKSEPTFVGSRKQAYLAVLLLSMLSGKAPPHMTISTHTIA